ncbi:HEAT repeat domain-containing protein [Nostoc punctiforme UO1]|uniref:HEAT repeat domain-containing protein n=1 Tax=Nostoc punctiforme TaxID=272131 RepID=UPI0030AEA465
MHDWQYFFNHDRSNLNQGTYRIFEPEWKAEILHWFSQKDVDKQQKEDFIQALIDFDDGCGDFYRYRAYFLAAEALSQFPECSLGDAIVEQLLKWSYAYFRQDKRDWQILPKPLVKTARKMLELTDRKRVIAAFVHLVHTTESRSILRVAAEELGTLDPGNKSAIAALVLMPITENRHGFCPRSYSLGKIAVGDETAIASLVQIIKTTPSEEIFFFAIIDLEKISVGNPTAIAALVHLMETTLNKGNCYNAIAALGKIAVGDQTAIAALVKFLQINQGDRICFDAAQALWQIDPSNAAVLKSLVHILETSANISLINRTATYLLKIEPENKTLIAGNKTAIATLSKTLESSQCDNERWQAAKSLLQVDSNNQVAINVLFELVQNLGQSPKYPDYAEFIANAASRSLSQIDPSNQLAIDALVQLIETAHDHSYLNLAVQHLGLFGAGNKIAITTLTELIASTKDDYLLCNAAGSLEKIDPGNKVALSMLCQVIETNQDESGRLYAIQNLLIIDPVNPKAMATLCQIRESNPYQHESILTDAVQNLEQLDLENKLVKEKLNEVIPTLIRFFQNFQQDDDNKNCCNNNATVQLSYESCLLDIADSLTKILPKEHLLQVVISLKDYLSKKFYQNNSYRYEAVFNIIWHCAENLTYPEFHKAIN